MKKIVIHVLIQLLTVSLYSQLVVTETGTKFADTRICNGNYGTNTLVIPDFEVNETDGDEFNKDPSTLVLKISDGYLFKITTSIKIEVKEVNIYGSEYYISKDRKRIFVQFQNLEHSSASNKLEGFSFSNLEVVYDINNPPTEDVTISSSNTESDFVDDNFPENDYSDKLLIADALNLVTITLDQTQHDLELISKATNECAITGHKFRLGTAAKGDEGGAVFSFKAGIDENSLSDVSDVNKNVAIPENIANGYKIQGTISSTNGCVYESSLITISLNNTLTSTVSQTTTGDCQGAGYEFTASPAGKDDYAFYVDDLEVTSNITNEVFSPTAIIPGEVVKTVITDGWCTKESTAIITTHTSPEKVILSIDNGKDQVCEGQEVEFTVSVNDVNDLSDYTLEFFIDDVSLTGKDIGGTVYNNTIIVDNTSNYSFTTDGGPMNVGIVGTIPIKVKATNSSTSCITQDMVEVTWDPEFNLTTRFIKNEGIELNTIPSLCAEDEIDIKVSSSVNGLDAMSFTSSNGGVTNSESINLLNTVFRFKTSEMIDNTNIDIKAVKGGCTINTNTGNFKVNITPEVNLTSDAKNNVEYCKGAEVIFTGTPLVSGDAYSYNAFFEKNDGPVKSISGEPSSSNVTFSTSSLSDDDIISLRIEDDNTKCVSATKSLTMSEINGVTLELISDKKSENGEISVCRGEEVEFIAFPSNYDGYLFRDGTDQVLETSDDNTFITSFESDNTVKVSIDGVDECGDNSEIQVNVLNTPIVSNKASLIRTSYTNNENNVPILISTSSAMFNISGGYTSYEITGEGTFLNGVDYFFGPSAWLKSEDVESSDITLTATNEQGCRASDVITLTISPSTDFVTKKDGEEWTEPVCSRLNPYKDLKIKNKITIDGVIYTLKDIDSVKVSPSNALGKVNTTTNTLPISTFFGVYSGGISISAVYTNENNEEETFVRTLPIIQSNITIEGINRYVCPWDSDTLRVTGFPLGGDFSIYYREEGGTDYEKIDESSPQYGNIKFIQNENDPDKIKELRFLATDLVSSGTDKVAFGGIEFYNHYKIEYEINPEATCVSGSNFFFGIMNADPTIRNHQFFTETDTTIVSCGPETFMFQDLDTSEILGYYSDGRKTYDIYWEGEDGLRVRRSGATVLDTHSFSKPGSYPVLIKLLESRYPYSQCGTRIYDTVIIGDGVNAGFGIKKPCKSLNTTLENLSGIIKPVNSIDKIETYRWTVNDSEVYHTENPSVNFKDTIQEIELYVETRSGCKDSISKNYTIYPYYNLTKDGGYLEDFNSEKIGWYSSGQLLDGVKNSWKWKVPSNDLGIVDDTVWVLENENATYNHNEISYVQSPCINLNVISKPFLGVDLWLNSEEDVDGLVLQYTFSGDSLVGDEEWHTLGQVGDGVNWYGSGAIIGDPGQQVSKWEYENAQGWSGITKGKVTSKISLESVKQEAKESQYVQFRFAFSSNTNNANEKIFKGIAFDNFLIDNRNKIVLSEQFVNVNQDANEKSQTDNFNTSFADVNGESFVHINYHINKPQKNIAFADMLADPFYKYSMMESSARSLHHGVEHPQRGVLDGIYFEDNPVYKDNWHEKTFGNRSLTASVFEFQPSILNTSGTQLQIESKLKNIDTNVLIEEPLVIHTAIIKKQDSFDGIEYYNIVKDLLPTAAGHKIDETWNWKENQTYSITNSWSINEAYLPSDEFYIVCFVEGIYSHQVYQASLPQKITDMPETINNGQKGVVSNVTNDLGNLITIGPNPVVNTLKIQSSDNLVKGKVEVIDILGQVVYLSESNHILTQNIELSSFPSGVYIVKITSSTQEIMRKVTKL